MVMVASLSKSLKLCHLLPTSQLLNSRLTAVSISYASLSSSSLPQPNPSPSPSQSRLESFARLESFVRDFRSPQNAVKERGIFFKMLLFLPGAISFGFGTWHFFQWMGTTKLRDDRAEKLMMEPVTSAELPFFSNSMDSLHYRRIECDGDFDEKKSKFITLSGSGEKVKRYGVITPFIPRQLAPGGVQTPILVHRGWVPQEWRDRIMSGEEDLDKASSSSVASNTKDEKTASWRNIWSKKPIHTAKEAVAPPTVKIDGVITKSGAQNTFLEKRYPRYPNDPEGGHWYTPVDPSMVRACGLSENAIYTTYIVETKEEYTSGAKSPYPVPHDINSLPLYGFIKMPIDMARSILNMLAGSLIATFVAAWKVWKMKKKV